MSQNYISIFTITPVQGFISQARKTRDLYAGSKILSELTKYAIKIALSYDNVEIIIPFIQNEDELGNIESIPNRFVAIFKNVNKEDLEGIGKNIEFKTLLYWKNDFSEKTLKKETSGNLNADFEKKFKDHITNYFNIYWIFSPFKNEYKMSYEEAESYLGAIKNLRCFQQFSTEENHRKCFLCGERDGIVYKNKKPAFSYENSLMPKRKDLLEENEGLCGVCFVKRFSDLGERFPSTSKVALFHLYDRLSDDVNKYIDIFENQKNFNEQLLFEENLTKKYFEDYGISEDKSEDKLEQARIELQKLYQKARENNIPITKYYALLKFDGDSMGKWLSGEFLEDKSKLKEFHKELSKKLREFAKWSQEYVNYPKGKAVYAGGDDFLGFINLTYLFEVLNTLRTKFDELVSQPIVNEFNLNKNLTFSAGIVIAHYKDPLSLVLEWVNKLEHEAKEIEGKDAFSIAVLKRSGGIRKTKLKWKYEDNNTVEKISNILKSLESDFNSSFIRKFEESFRKIPIESKEFKYINTALPKSELKRTLKRSSNLNKKETKKKLDELLEKDIIPLLNLSLKNEDISFPSFINLLNIIHFIDKELN